MFYRHFIENIFTFNFIAKHQGQNLTAKIFRSMVYHPIRAVEWKYITLRQK